MHLREIKRIAEACAAAKWFVFDYDRGISADAARTVAEALSDSQVPVCAEGARAVFLGVRSALVALPPGEAYDRARRALDEAVSEAAREYATLVVREYYADEAKGEAKGELAGGES